MTGQAETESALDRLRADMARRETRLMLVIVGTIVVVGCLATAVLGILITSA